MDCLSHGALDMPVYETETGICVLHTLLEDERSLIQCTMSLSSAIKKPRNLAIADKIQAHSSSGANGSSQLSFLARSSAG